MAKGSAATVLAVLAAAALLCLCDPAAAALPRLEHPAKNDGSLCLRVVGDWGRKGACNQSRVAEQVTSMFISLRPPPMHDPFLFVGVENMWSANQAG
jgi:hypothetical protein